MNHQTNPFQFFSDPMLQLTKLDAEVASQKIIPTYQAPFVQAIFNPKNFEELITVQMCQYPKHDNLEH